MQAARGTCNTSVLIGISEMHRLPLPLTLGARFRPGVRLVCQNPGTHDRLMRTAVGEVKIKKKSRARPTSRTHRSQVDNINAFGQAGGFEALIVRLSPRETLEPAPASAGNPTSLPPRPRTSANAPPISLETPIINPSETRAQQQGISLSPVTETLGSVSSVNVAAAVDGGYVRNSGGGAGSAGVPLKALQHALVAVSSVRALLARRVARAVIDRTATAVAAALKR